MHLSGTHSAFTSIFGKTLLFLTFIGILTSCEKSEPTEIKGPLGGGYSILLHNENVLISGFKSVNGQLSTTYWLNGESTDQTTFMGLIENQSTYREAVDEKSRTVQVYKDQDGTSQFYQFDQANARENAKVHYYKNGSIFFMDNDSTGMLSAVSFQQDSPVFAGAIGQYIQSIDGNSVLYPEIAFVWDGHSPITELSMLSDSTSFKGVSTIYQAGNDEFYVGGLYDRPMYWKNTDPIVLDERYGEVWQITKSASDVYAVGFLNKHNSNSTGHTACYWKNGELHELEDHAQAYGIFIDGEDIYVTGAVGRVPTDYRPCYWLNGQRIDLPM